MSFVHSLQQQQQVEQSFLRDSTIFARQASNADNYFRPVIVSYPKQNKDFHCFMKRGQQQKSRIKGANRERLPSIHHITATDSFPPSPPLSVSSLSSCNNMTTHSYHRRKPSNPSRSLPSTTKGAFHIPIIAPFTIPPHCDKARKQHNVSIYKNEQPNICIAKNENLRLCMETAPSAHSKSIAESGQQDMTQTPDRVPSDQNSEDSFQASLEQSVITTATDCNALEKSKSDAARLYHIINADYDIASLFHNSEEWIPSLDVFQRKPKVRISWKGAPLKIKSMPYYDKLHPSEAGMASTLRLTPEQYLKCKWSLILAAKEASENNTLFRKSEAQKVCCIDVNKTSILWHAFGKLGWLGPKWPQ